MRELRMSERMKVYGWGMLCLCGFIVFIVTACAQQGPQVATIPAETQAPTDDYLIGPEDTVEVLVWKNADLSRVVSVRPDGKISLPLIGDVQAAGVTVSSLNADITERLKKYYKEPPQVSVILQQVNSYSIYILGEVRSPGKFLVKSGTTFLQAVTLSGGFTEFASKNKIMVRRKSESSLEKVIYLRYSDILSGSQDNIMMIPGDTILVQ